MHVLPWLYLSLETTALAAEASSVIALRLTKMALGDAAALAEAQTMIGEKVVAAFELQALALTGQLGRTPATAARRSVRHYRRAVKANRRRLARG